MDRPVLTVDTRQFKLLTTRRKLDTLATVKEWITAEELKIYANRRK